MYKTTDGKFFETESEAQDHMHKIDFENQYSKNAIDGKYGDRLEGDDVLMWLRINKECITKILQVI